MHNKYYSKTGTFSKEKIESICFAKFLSLETGYTMGLPVRRCMNSLRATVRGRHAHSWGKSLTGVALVRSSMSFTPEREVGGI